MLKQIILASGNKGKLAELSQLLAPLNIQVNLQSEFGVTECEEPFDTFIENALIKARHASRITGLPALADDSGLCVDALGGMPGVYSARYAGEPKSDDKNNQKLCQTLAEFDDKKSVLLQRLCLSSSSQRSTANHHRWTLARANNSRTSWCRRLWLRSLFLYSLIRQNSGGTQSPSKKSVFTSRSSDAFVG